ncbi:MAG TPA: bifunctional phosphoribosylaminoimidazolecarboxamide formyltransferase/IMP cyclohydrolase [Gemmatales bacterium]|nr:bifunctional phosphoribosylaminoimidazolecarboxamide formyltransferase/IMP cyclohydrolase [Gemmatales bacterium]HMP58869.1 bifunctional phosphoribosylaminoimidazolecarboxamide formyltransferase/IMP cyclohydrolase [Gemmatales bacterium]
MADRRIQRALLSVSDKSGLVALAQFLQTLGVELISTGGTRQALLSAGVPARDIAEVTGFAEILDGRVKTLHPHIHAGILARRDDPRHGETLTRHGISTIDLIVSNLYPFENVVAAPGSSPEQIIENIDIGGPTLVRAAAKNFHDVAVVTDPGQYEEILAEMRERDGILSLATRQKLAMAAFSRIAAYDQAIAAYFAHVAGQTERFPTSLHLSFSKRIDLRYGENPHQSAAFYIEPGATHPCVATAKVLHGKELSYNNLLDLDSALNLVRDFDRPAAAIIKHNNPCGAAEAEQLDQAFHLAYESDPQSAFGGVFAFNRVVDAATAEQIAAPNRFVEAVIAPGFTPEAWHLLTTRPKWKDTVRLLEVGELQPGPATALEYRRVDGGLLVQTRDHAGADWANLRTVTRRAPTEAELADLAVAWRVVRHVKSNAIVLAKGGMVVGVGAGQMSRVDAVHLAAHKAGERARASVLASDAFFPFRDNVDAAAAVGVTAIVQPGGSVRDNEAIAAADEHGLAMVFTGVRHFRH